MGEKINKFIYWTPRILSIIFILFLAIFSLDVFDMKLGFRGTVLGLFMHNIPVFILSIVLLISWKHEIVGGIAFTLAGTLYIVILLMNMLRNSFEWYMVSWILIIAGPAFLIGILFIINWLKKRNNQKDAIIK
jgi:thiol:disulfide interchange protein